VPVNDLLPQLFLKGAGMSVDKMRRAEKQITDAGELYRILDDALVLRLAMIDGETPYVVPLNFARHEDELWMHCAAEGRKLRCLRANPRVCVEVDRLFRVTTGPSACNHWTSHYESAIGFGTAVIVDDDEQRRHGLKTIMRKYSGRSDWTFSPTDLADTTVVKVKLDSLTGKRSPAKE
jgi:uncharacterized protein